ncbi:MAG: NAD(P)H-dependent oxidoreductase subunit E [Myxococcales bacterium]|nr:NAD(P)H-dependent oxidoreductase subunit E [Myxococcales bacterium]
MDVRPTAPPPTEDERRAVDAALGPPDAEGPVTASEARARRTHLLPALRAVQERLGFVSEGALGYVCARLGLPPAEGYGVASFYALLALGERPRAFAHVCDDVACRAAGAERLCADVEKSLGPAFSAPHRADPGQPHPKTAARWARSPCLGLCEQAPAALVTVAGAAPVEQAFGGATVDKVRRALGGEPVEPLPCTLGGAGPRRLLARAGVVDATSLDDYRRRGGYEALRRALEVGPEAVLREVTDAKLVGRGGAAFPTGRKWDAVAKAPVRPHYVVCNADESEPGTFKDRVLLELDPFSLVEAMTLAGFAVGAEQGYLYLRGEYPLARRRLENALAKARARGLLGGDVMGRGVRFELELRVGAGAYICGEETALFNSIEGFRGEPRSKPPFPVQAGLFGKPTAINNVETLVATLDIVREGAAAYASVGTAGSPGTKLFCVSGAVQAPGVYEVPFGTSLGALLALCGGVKGRLRAILLGGAAGTFVGPEALDLPLSFEGARAAGATLGSGVVLVLDDSVDLRDQLRRLAAFFRDESCGQCVPCRVGTVRQEELLARLARGAPSGSVKEELQLLRELGQAMRDASICGLGQTASSAVESAVKLGVFEGKP